MKNQTQKRVGALVAILCAAGALTFIAAGGIGDNLIYFWDVDELLKQGDKAYGQTIRLGGVVVPGTYKLDEQALEQTFNVAAKRAPGAPSVLAHATGAPPQMFREGIGVVLEGTYNGKVFEADRVIVKHSNEYKPPAADQKPKDIYKTLVD